MSKRAQWTPKLDRQLRKGWTDPTIRTRDLAKKMGLTYSAILTRAVVLKIRRPKAGKRLSQSKKVNPDRLVHLYLTRPNDTAARLLGIGNTLLIRKAQELGLVKPCHLKTKGQFKSGHTTWNKGTKGLTGRNRTTWKKGQKSMNEKPVGTVVTRYRYNRKQPPTKWIKTAAGWVTLARHTWEQAHGPVPKGHRVHFKNGDTLDVRLDNLELLSGPQAMRRNSGAVNLPDGMIAHFIAPRDPELKKLILKQPELLKLKRAELEAKRKT